MISTLSSNGRRGSSTSDWRSTFRHGRRPEASYFTKRSREPRRHSSSPDVCNDSTPHPGLCSSSQSCRTVTSEPRTGQGPVPASPNGRVSRSACRNTVCTVRHIWNLAAASRASCGPTTRGTHGAVPVTAVYTNTDGGFNNCSGTGSWYNRRWP